MTEPVPLRLGDAERAEAAEVLQQHLGDGRLELDELEERAAAVWRARYAADLAPLFADLPAPHPRALVGGAAPTGPAVDWNAPRRQPALPDGSGVRRRLAAIAVASAAVLALVALVNGGIPGFAVLLPLALVAYVMWADRR